MYTKHGDTLMCMEHVSEDHGNEAEMDADIDEKTKNWPKQSIRLIHLLRGKTLCVSFGLRVLGFFTKKGVYLPDVCDSKIDDEECDIYIRHSYCVGDVILSNGRKFFGAFEPSAVYVRMPPIDLLCEWPEIGIPGMCFSQGVDCIICSMYTKVSKWRECSQIRWSIDASGHMKCVSDKKNTRWCWDPVASILMKEYGLTMDICPWPVHRYQIGLEIAKRWCECSQKKQAVRAQFLQWKNEMTTRHGEAFVQSSDYVAQKEEWNRRCVEINQSFGFGAYPTIMDVGQFKNTAMWTCEQRNTKRDTRCGWCGIIFNQEITTKKTCVTPFTRVGGTDQALVLSSQWPCHGERPVIFIPDMGCMKLRQMDRICEMCVRTNLRLPFMIFAHWHWDVMECCDRA